MSLLFVCSCSSIYDEKEAAIYDAELSEKSEIICKAYAKEIELRKNNRLTLQMEREADNNFAIAHCGVKENIKAIQDLKIKASDGYGIPVRRYIPSNEAMKNCVLIFFHGGGFIEGNIETHDYLCRKIANSLGVQVFSVDYRLAPEHKFPAAVNDAFDVFSRLSKEYSKKNVIIAGESAGGNLCAALCIKINREGFKKPLAQILIYPLLSGDFESKSFQAYGEGGMLLKSEMEPILKQYIGDAERSDPLIFPILQKDMSVFPETVFIAAEYDVLLDGQLAFKAKLEKERIRTRMIVSKGTIHGFTVYGEVFEEEITDSLKKTRDFFK
ncbi:MAG: alpha/beta hydrolase [Holosporaceae bacterium]|nr:alpha/beta hydrolase [Holosporaceae bacterium]